MRAHNSEIITFNNFELFDLIHKLEKTFEDMPPIELLISPKSWDLSAGRSGDVIEVRMPVNNAYTLEDAFDIISLIHSVWNPLQLDYNEGLGKYSMNHDAFATVALYALTGQTFNALTGYGCRLNEGQRKFYEEFLRNIAEQYGIKMEAEIMSLVDELDKMISDMPGDEAFFSVVELFEYVDDLEETFEDIPPMRFSIGDKDCELTALPSDDLIEIKMPLKKEYTLDDIFELTRMIRLCWMLSQDTDTEDTVAQADSYAFANAALWTLIGYDLGFETDDKEAEKLYQKALKSIAEEYDIDID